ncbi:hypothetical protein [Nonomuraea sp. NPDC046570]
MSCPAAPKIDRSVAWGGSPMRLVIQRLYRHGYLDMARMERMVAHVVPQ